MKHVPDKPGAYVFGVHFKSREFQAFKNDDFLADFESDFDSWAFWRHKKQFDSKEENWKWRRSGDSGMIFNFQLVNFNLIWMKIKSANSKKDRTRTNRRFYRDSRAVNIFKMGKRRSRCFFWNARKIKSSISALDWQLFLEKAASDSGRLKTATDLSTKTDKQSRLARASSKFRSGNWWERSADWWDGWFSEDKTVGASFW